MSTQFENDTKHLNIDIWNRVNRNLLAKALSELIREDIAKPKIIHQEEDSLTFFRLESDIDSIYYEFSAYPRFLNYWYVQKESMRKYVENKEVDCLDVADFFIDMQNTFGIESFTLTHYVEELLRTLYADAFIISKGRPTAASLADANFQTIEHSMGGHPWVIANKGRIGFNSNEYAKYAPEADKSTHLLWVAVHKNFSFFHVSTSVNKDNFYEQELGIDILKHFKDILKTYNADLNDYFLIPVHTWQWETKIAMQYACDIAAGYIIPLEMGSDKYSPQQSIRTFHNITSPQKNNVKAAISILNTSHIRGLSPKQLSIAPQLTDWLKNMFAADPYLQKMGVVFLGEIASASYSHSKYGKIKDPPYQYNEFLGAIWRQSPVAFLKSDEKLATMASLLYQDENGRGFVQELIYRSGISTEEWIKKYLRVYLKPILQIYYKHSVSIDPHGQNVILILKNNIPERIVLQDFVGDILINEQARAKFPQEFIDNMFPASPNPENAPLTILIAVFDAFYRYLSVVLEETIHCSEKVFWGYVYQIITEYQEEHPELKQEFIKYDILISEFKRMIFNSRRLFGGYNETSGFPHMRKVGFVPNPLYQLKYKSSGAESV